MKKKTIPKKNNYQPNKRSGNLFASLLLLSGIAILLAGFYFKNNDFTSSGAKMGKYGNNGTGTINGGGMIFCGSLILLFGIILVLPDKNKKDQ